MARTRDVLTGVGQAGAQIGEALLKVAMMRDDRQQRATSNALNMVQLDQAERRIDQDARQMEAAALRHKETTAFNLTQATAITGDKLRAMMEKGYVLPEGMSFSEGVQKIRNGENPGDWGDWVDSIEGQAHQQKLDMETAEAKNLSQWYSGEGHGPGGAPFPAGSLSERAKKELDRGYIVVNGRTYRSDNHPDVISGALESEEEAAKQWISEVGMANLSPFEQEMARQITRRFEAQGGKYEDLVNLDKGPTDSVLTPEPTDSAEFRSNDDGVSGTATEQREGEVGPVLLSTDTAGAQPDPQEVDTLTAAFNPNAEADEAAEAELRRDALSLMAMEQGPSEIVNMDLEQVMDWLREANLGER